MLNVIERGIKIQEYKTYLDVEPKHSGEDLSGGRDLAMQSQEVICGVARI